VATLKDDTIFGGGGRWVVFGGVTVTSPFGQNLSCSNQKWVVLCFCHRRTFAAWLSYCSCLYNLALKLPLFAVDYTERK